MSNEPLPTVQKILAPHYVIERHPQPSFASGANLAQWVQVMWCRRDGILVGVPAYTNGAPHPGARACPFLLRVAEAWAEQQPNAWERGRWLGSVAEALVGSSVDDLRDRIHATRARQDRLIDWSRRVYLAAWLAAAGLDDLADVLRESPCFLSAKGDVAADLRTRLDEAYDADREVAHYFMNVLNYPHLYEVFLSLQVGRGLIPVALGEPPPSEDLEERVFRFAIARRYVATVRERRPGIPVSGALGTEQRACAAATLAYFQPMVEELQTSLQAELVGRLDSADSHPWNASYQRTHEACTRALAARIARDGVAS